MCASLWRCGGFGRHSFAFVYQVYFVQVLHWGNLMTVDNFYIFGGFRHKVHYKFISYVAYMYMYSWCSTYGSHLTILLIFFLFVWIKYLTFYISKVLFLRSLKVLWFYKFDFLKQYLRELFNTASGFHFGTKSSTSGSHAFICLHYWIEVSRLFFLSLKNINLII